LAEPSFLEEKQMLTQCAFASALRLFVVAVVVVLCTISLSAATAVGNCRPDLPSFDTFADAIAGTPTGGTINVCPGTYAEQFTITKNLTINGIASGNGGLPVVVPPAGGLLQNIVTYNVPSGFIGNRLIAAQVIVNPGLTVNIRNISIDATNNNLPNCSVPVGIYFADSSGTVNHVVFRNQLTLCNAATNPQGDAVLVQSDGTLPAVVSVLNSSFHNPGWMAMHADGAGADVTLKNNTAVGPGATSGNGILVESGAGATAITNNTESNALPNNQGTGYWGILLNGCAGNSLVNTNTLSNTQVGIYVSCGTNTVSGNTVFNSQLDGIVVCGSGNTVNGNTINDSGRAGVNIAQGCADSNNLVYNNTVDGACAATLIGTDAGVNSIGPNTIFNSKYLSLAGATCN
jgi:parallel beta-helix repeat protein